MRAELLERRVARLESLRDSDAYTRGITALGRIHGAEKHSLQPQTVALRPKFVRTSDPALRPNSSLLIKPRGLSQQLFLTALFEAQSRLPPGRRWSNAREYSYDPDGHTLWLDLLTVDVDASQKTVQNRSETTNRLRQLDGAVRSLDKARLLGIATNAGRRKMSDFTLYSELGAGDLATPRIYSVPQPAGQLLIPSEFWLNGWGLVLQPSEVAAWLMFRELARTYPAVHETTGIYIYGEDREDIFNLSRDAYEAHMRLEDYGLLTCLTTISVVPGGIILGARDRYEPHRFQLDDDGLKQDALSTVLSVTERNLAARKSRP